MENIFIPPIIHTNSYEKPLEKCPKCGHQYYKEEEPEKPLKLWHKLLIGFVFALILVLILWVVDVLALNARYSNNILYKSECDYVVPAGWKIVYDGEMYAVREDNEYNKTSYLYDGGRGVTTMDITIGEPLLFFTECKAKACLKSYLEGKQPKMKGFK